MLQSPPGRGAQLEMGQHLVGERGTPGRQLGGGEGVLFDPMMANIYKRDCIRNQVIIILPEQRKPLFIKIAIRQLLVCGLKRR